MLPLVSQDERHHYDAEMVLFPPRKSGMITERSLNSTSYLISS